MKRYMYPTTEITGRKIQVGDVLVTGFGPKSRRELLYGVVESIKGNVVKIQTNRVSKQIVRGSVLIVPIEILNGSTYYPQLIDAMKAVHEKERTTIERLLKQ
jgi:small-conductance mechanosensitive channel